MRKTSSETSSNSEGVQHTVLPQIPQAAQERHEGAWNRSQEAQSRHYPKMEPLTRRNKQSGCWIPSCTLERCNLSTHQRPSWVWKGRSPSAMTSATTSTTTSGASSHISVERALDEIPDLPEPVLTDGELKELLYQSISYDIPRLCCLFEPPPLSPNSRYVIELWQQEGLSASLSSPLSVLVHVCFAHIHRLARCGQLERDKISTKLYGQLLKLFRIKIEFLEPGEAGDLILAFTALVLFDITMGHVQAVETHRTIFPKLVDHYGLYNHGSAMASHCISVIDKLMATLTNQPQLYSRKPDRRLCRPSKTVHRYGTRFGFAEIRIDLNLDNDVAHVCEDICRGIEIVEKEEWTFQPGRLERPYDAANIQYLYFLRNNISDYAAYLQGKDLQNPDKNKPILLAALLVEYIVLQVGYLPFWPTLLGDQLLEILESQNLQHEWEGYEDVLCWFMCVMVIIPKTWTNRPAAMRMFGRWLMSEPARNIVDQNDSGVEIDAICNPHDFVWSASVLDKDLSAALQEIRDLMETDAGAARQTRLVGNTWHEFEDDILGF